MSAILLTALSHYNPSQTKTTNNRGHAAELLFGHEDTTDVILYPSLTLVEVALSTQRKHGKWSKRGHIYYSRSAITANPTQISACVQLVRVSITVARWLLPFRVPNDKQETHLMSCPTGS